uniref:Amino acid transporter transmembrane domain-containing protein n=1 Tax=Aegilops tauschii subsp. strangulata TaxID=200361 RepID=A0A453Q0E6_AEGTS
MHASMDDNPMNIGIERRGTVLTAIWHVITILLGSGVLALAWSFAQLGWVAGPIVSSDRHGESGVHRCFISHT